MVSGDGGDPACRRLQTGGRQRLIGFGPDGAAAWPVQARSRARVPRLQGWERGVAEERHA